MEESQPFDLGPDQLKLDDQPGFWGIAQTSANLRAKLHKRETAIEMQPFWRHFSGPIALVSGTVLPLLLTVIALVNIGKFPPKMPFIFDHTIGVWQQADKSVFAIAPILLLVFNVIIIRLSLEVYEFDRRLAEVSNWLIVFINLLALIAAGQIFSLVSY